MTEEPEHRETATAPEKLLIDDPSNFRFHAAYLAYSNVFDRMTNAEAKKRLNESITALQGGEIDFAGFYASIEEFRGEDTSRRGFGRTLIRTQRKRDWRRKTQKHERIERHKR